MSKNGKNPNGEDVNNVSDAREALDKTLSNLSVEADSETIGAGYRVKHMNRADDAAILKAKKEKNKSKSHHTLLIQIQDRIDDLQSQIKVLQGKIDELNEKIDESTEKIAKYDEQLAKLKAQGKEGSPEWLAVIALRNEELAEREEFIDLRNDYQDRVDGLNDHVDDLLDAQAANDPVAMQAALDKSSGSELYHAAHTNDGLTEVVGNEFSDRMGDGFGEHEIVDSAASKDDLFDDFFGEDLFLEAEKLEIADNFAKAASGEIKSPEVKQEVTPQDPSQNISMNV